MANANICTTHTNVCTNVTAAFERLYRQAQTPPKYGSDLCPDRYYDYHYIKVYKDPGDVYLGLNDICDEAFRVVTVVDCKAGTGDAAVYIGENGAIGLLLVDPTDAEASHELTAFNLNGDGVFGPYDIGTQESFDVMMSILESARFYVE